MTEHTSKWRHLMLPAQSSGGLGNADSTLGVPTGLATDAQMK